MHSPALKSRQRKIRKPTHAAAAPSTSCLLARVHTANTAQNSSVLTSTIPTHSPPRPRPRPFSRLTMLNSSQMGTASSAPTSEVRSRLAQKSMREGV